MPVCIRIRVHGKNTGQAGRPALCRRSGTLSRWTQGSVPLVLAQRLLCFFHHRGVFLDLIHVTRAAPVGVIGKIVLGIVVDVVVVVAAAATIRRTLLCQQFRQHLGGFHRVEFLQEPAAPRVYLIDNVPGDQCLGLAVVRRQVI